MTMPITNTSFYRNTFLVIVAHFLVYIALYFILFNLGYIKSIPSDSSVMQWDSIWYKRIIDNGYSFDPNQRSNVAFFPLFPLLWKATSLSPILMSILNLLFMITGIVLLRNTLKFSDRKLLLFLSIPCLFFCYVPYSEALFFLSGSLIIYGLKKENWVVYLGIFLSCLTRSASLIFIPIILFSKMYNYQPHERNKKLIIETSILVFISFLSLMVSQYIQYLGSGRFFTLFQTQKHWDRVLGFPRFPLTTWDQGRLLWLDGLAFFVGLLAMVICVSLLLKKIKRWDKTVPSYYLFSIGYLALVTIVTLMFSSAKGPTNLYSLNRFVFASPFFVVFLYQNLNYKNEFKKREAFSFIVICLVAFLLLGVNGRINELDYFAIPMLNTKIYFGIIFLYSLLYLVIANKKNMGSMFYGLYLLNMLLQIYLFQHFISGEWVG